MKSFIKNSSSKALLTVITSTLLALPAASAAPNIWTGAGVGANTGSDWTLPANYGGTFTSSIADDMDFSTINTPGAGLTLSAAAGSYNVKSLIFGSAGSTLTVPEMLNFNGNAGGTTLNLAGNIVLPKIAGSVVTLGSDLTINLTDANHNVAPVSAANVLVINSLITGGGASTSFYNSSTAPMIFTNTNNSFTSGGLSGQRFNGHVGYTSVGNVGSGNSSLGNASTVANGLLWMSNSSVLDYVGAGDQSTDRSVRLDGTVNFSNSSTGTTVTFNGALIPNNFFGPEIRSSSISGSTVVINSVISGVFGVRKQSGTTYSTATGASSANDGLGTLVLGGVNTYSGVTTVGIGTLKITNASALGTGGVQSSTAGGTVLLTGGVLDLNGQTNVQESIGIIGTGISSGGALINNSATTATIGTGIAASTVAASTGSGSGYSSAPTVTISGTGSGAAATASLGVTAASFALTLGDKFYTTAPTVSILGGGGAGATATAILSGGTTGTITGIAITNAGNGFTTTPTIAITGGAFSGGTTNTTGVGNATNFTVNGLAMTSNGSGYVGTPTYSFSGGGGSGATASGALSGVVLTGNSSIGGTGNIVINSAVTEIGAGRTLTKVGAGTLTLGGNNTYTGATTVSAGTLLINGVQTAATGAVTVSSGATLGGSGTLGGASTVQTGGTLSPGNSPGTLAFNGNLTLAGGLDAAGATAIFEAGDLVAVNGILTLTNDWNLTLTSPGYQAGGTMTLFTYSTVGGTRDLTPDFTFDPSLGFTPSGLTLTDTGSAIILNGLSAVPEPTTVAMLGLGLLLVLQRSRRRLSVA